MARLIVLFLLFPAIIFAQNIAVSGKVSGADTKAPLGRASVFLSNSSFGTSTAPDGTFILNGLKPGQYNLVVTTVGYEEHTETILITNDPVKLNIELSPKSVQLKEVNISTLSKADLKMALEQFKQEFIGEDENARDCKIINPEVLNFSFHQNKNVLEAYNNDFLIVENHALGYRIKFLLKNFKSERLTGRVVYTGQRFFEELPAKGVQKKKWLKNRDDAYYGSAMHFYRALYTDSLASAGFKIYGLTRILNPNRPTEEVIQQHLNKAKGLQLDSFLYWTNMKQTSRYKNQILSSDQLAVKDILRRTNQPGLFAVMFTDYLYVIYTKKWEANYFKDLYRAPDNLNYATTIISLMNNNQGTLFDRNGTVIGDSPLYEGTWANARLSEMIPVDYTPGAPPNR